jgi:hypothetical protein
MDLDDVKGEGLSVTWPTPFISHNTASGRQKVLSGRKLPAEGQVDSVSLASVNERDVLFYEFSNNVSSARLLSEYFLMLISRCSAKGMDKQRVE